MTISVDFEELAGSPHIQATLQQYRATERLKCAWSDAGTLMIDLFGGGAAFSPLPFRLNAAARVRDVRIQPFHGSDVLADEGNDSYTAYTHAEVVVEYATPDVDDPNQTPADSISESIDVAKEFMTFPGAKLYTQGGGDQGEPMEGSEVGLQVGMMEWQVTRHDLTKLPAAAASLLGHCNSSSVSSTKLGLSFATETLLYESLSLRLKTTPQGIQLVDPTFRLIHRPTGWNKVLDPESGNWIDVYLEGESSPYKPFTPGNLAAMWA